MTPNLGAKITKSLKPALQPVPLVDGWTKPTDADVDPQDYPWEHPKI